MGNVTKFKEQAYLQIKIEKIYRTDKKILIKITGKGASAIYDEDIFT